MYEAKLGTETTTDITKIDAPMKKEKKPVREPEPRVEEKNAKAKKKNSKKEEEPDNNKITLTPENEEFIKQSMRNFCLQNQMKATTFRNNVPNYDNVLNNKENEKNEKSKYNTNTYNPNDIKSKTVMIQKNKKEKDKKKKSAEEEKEKIEEEKKEVKVEKRMNEEELFGDIEKNIDENIKKMQEIHKTK